MRVYLLLIGWVSRLQLLGNVLPRFFPAQGFSAIVTPAMVSPAMVPVVPSAQ